MSDCRRTRTTLFILSFLASSSFCAASVCAQNCGAPPPKDFQYSGNFQKAALKIVSSSAKQSDAADANILSEAGVARTAHEILSS